MELFANGQEKYYRHGRVGYLLGVLCVESETAVVCCKSGGLTCVCPRRGRGHGVHGRPVGCWRREIILRFAIAIGMKECWVATTEFGEETVIKKAYLQVVVKEFGRPRSGSTLSVWKPVCGSVCEEQKVVVPVPLFVGSPVPQFLEETAEVMKLVPQERVQQPTASKSGRGIRGGLGPD